MAVIHSHGPSIRHEAMLASCVSGDTCQARVELAVEVDIGIPDRTPKSRSNGRDRQPRRIGNRCADICVVR
jgi:hypothetical protein